MKKNKLFLSNKGFTLIELLVVIFIIGVLSSMAVVSLNNARSKAQDALRKADMAQMRTAINLYYDDQQKYPICGTWDSAAADFGAKINEGSTCYNTILETALIGGARPYMGKLPKDPKNLQNDPAISNVYLYRYVGKSDGSQYALVYRIDSTSELQVIRGW